jgi:hypothetical protein
MEIILTKSTRVHFLSRIKLRITIIALISMGVGALLGLLYYFLLNSATSLDTILMNPFFTSSYGIILGGLMSIKK